MSGVLTREALDAAIEQMKNEPVLRPKHLFMSATALRKVRARAAEALRSADRLTAEWVALPWWRWRKRRRLQEQAMEALRFNVMARGTFGW